MRTSLGSARSILDQRVFGRRIRAHIISLGFISLAVIIYVLMACSVRAQNSDLKWKRTNTPTSFSTTQAYEASRSNSQPVSSSNVRSGSVSKVQYEEIDLGKSAPVQTIQPGARPSTSRSVSTQLPPPSSSSSTPKQNDVFDKNFPEVNQNSNQPKSVLQNSPSSNVASPMPTQASPMQIEELPHGGYSQPEHIQAPMEHYQGEMQYSQPGEPWHDYLENGGHDYPMDYGPRNGRRFSRRGCNECDRGCGEGLFDCLLGDYVCPDDSCCGEGDCGCDQCGGCEDGCGCGECGDCGCYTGNRARHPMLYGLRRFVRSTLLCVVGGCDPCDEGTFGCGPTPECTWDRDLSIFGGVEAFRGGLDRGRNGNFGYHEGVNWGMQLWRGVGFQVGGNFTQTNLNENGLNIQQRNQSFLTAGIFRRQMNYCGWQYGAVYDQLYDDFTQNIDVAQVRGELSYVYGKAELGFSFAKNQKTDAIQSLTFTTLDQYNLFLRRKLFLNGEGRLWIGMTENSGTLTGGEFRMAMNDAMAIQTSVNYYSPKDNDDQTMEGWNIGLSLVWYPGMSACATGKSQYRPLFNVADNGTMMLRTE